jgi:beta-1,4-mannosyl-glycoprotein beta-1,4-N-acetylglucosaminyltransferase
MTIRIIDTFPFNGDWVIKMRLEFMFPFVDEFVITESRYTFSGVKKDFLYRDKWSKLLEHYQSKITWVIVDEFPQMTEEWHNAYKENSWFREESRQAWFNEHYQRDVAFEYIKEKYKDDDYIVNVGDVDEIPNTDIFYPDSRRVMLNKLQEIQQPLYLEMLFFYYNFYWKKPYNWYRAYIIDKGQLLKNPSMTHWRLNHLPNLVLRGAGWHFSYFMEIADIQRKIQSFSHKEYNDPQWTSVDHIKECIAQGKDIFNREENENLVHDDTIVFPDPIISHRGEIDYIQMT